MEKYPHNPTTDYAERVEALEAEGMTTSDAQAVVDAEIMMERSKAMSKSNDYYMSELEKAHDMIEELAEILEEFASEDSEPCPAQGKDTLWHKARAILDKAKETI